MTAMNGPKVSYKIADDIFKAGDKDRNEFTTTGLVMMEHSLCDDTIGNSLAAFQVPLSSSSVRTCSLLSLCAAHALRRRSAAQCRSALASARLLESNATS